MTVITRDNYWIRFGKREQSSSFSGTLAGKYLIFSKNQKLLLDICETEIKQHRFEVAKVSVIPRHNEYVCCLYWDSDERKFELAQRYKNNPELKYRYWKSNADTRAGKYSDKFLNKKKE